MQRRVLFSLPLVGSALAVAACDTPRQPATHVGHHHGSADHHGHHSAMCVAHRQAMARPSPAEQQAALEAQVKSMHGSTDAQRVALHRQVMDLYCGAVNTAPVAK